MRTLVVSDLHLGARRGRAVLDDPGCRRALAEAITSARRLVLLGDVIELRERPLRQVLADVRPVLEAIAAARPADCELIVLAGNHDHRLIEPWLGRRDQAIPLGASAAVSPADGDPLAEIVAALGGGEVRYPGVTLRGGGEAPGDEGGSVWATHGHYSDRHTTVPIFERLAAGVMARLTREPAGGPAGAEDYETALAPVYAWIDANVEYRRRGAEERERDGSEQAWVKLNAPAGRDLRRHALKLAYPLAIAALNRAGIGPLRADLAGGALRRGALVAMGEVARTLGVGGAHVLFGHTHRAGPLPGDDLREWRTPGGARLMNTGCWVRETTFLGPDPSRSPYRAGFAAWVDSGPPQLVNLLD